MHLKVFIKGILIVLMLSSCGPSSGLEKPSTVDEGGGSEIDFEIPVENTGEESESQVVVTVPLGGTGACVSSDKLTCVETTLPLQPQSRLAYKPTPTMVYAFKIITPSSGMYFNRVIATVMTGATSSKLLVVSKVPGDVSLSNKDTGCYRLAVESTSVELAVNNASANRHLYCRLDPNTVYYINAASRDLNGKATCTATSNCGFYFEGA